MEHERTYATRQGVKAGLKTQGLDHLKYEITVRIKAGTSVYRATVFVHTSEDKHEVERRGFAAEINKEKAAV